MNNKIERILTIYDGTTEELLSMLPIAKFDLNAFKQQFDVDPNDDPEMYLRYAIGPDDLTFLQPFLSSEIDFDFRSNAYFIESVENDLS